MDRRSLILGLGGGLAGLGLPRRARAATPADGKMFKVFMVLFRGETEIEEGLRDYFRLRERNIDFVVRNIARDSSKLPEVVQEIKATRPDLVYTWGTGVTLGIAGRFDDPNPDKFIRDIPIVFAPVADPVGAGIVPRLASSGRNVTGVVHIAPVESQIKAIMAYRPLKKLGVLYNRLERNSVSNIEELTQLAPKLGFELLAEPVALDSAGQPSPDSVPPLVNQLAAKGTDFFYIGPDTFIGDQRDAYTGSAIDAKVPVFTGTELEILHSNAMVGFVSRYRNVGQFAAYKVEQILWQGKSPAEIPIETLKRFSYIIRMSVAKKLGIYPPMKILRFAEIVNE